MFNPSFYGGGGSDGAGAAAAGVPTSEADAAHAAAPFVIEHLRLRDSRSSSAGFVPSARLLLTSALRTSGLLAALPDREAKSLLALLTFLSPNGGIHPAYVEIAPALNVSEREARERLRRLCAFTWQGEPLAREVPRESGLDCVTVSGHVVAAREAEDTFREDETSHRQVSYVPAGREAVIAHSRAMYAKPREEVEKMVLEQLGHSPLESEDTPEGEIRRSLRGLGVSAEQVELLLSHHSIEEIQRQIDWLPHRHAKSPGRLIVAAIENDYEPPAYVRLQQALAREEEQHLEAGAATAADDEDDVPFAEDGDTEQGEIEQLYLADDEDDGAGSDITGAGEGREGQE